MIDLAHVRDGGHFAQNAPVRLALLHRSFRVIDRNRGLGRKLFGAHFPPLGLLNLAHSLRVDVAAGVLPAPAMRVFDEEMYLGEDSLFAAVVQWLAGPSRAIIMATTYTSTIHELEAFLSRFPQEKYLTVVGGPHVTLAPDFEHAHVLVRGEGGAAMRHILSTVLTPEFGQGPDAAGICYALDGRTVVRKQAFDRSLEQLPSPAFAYDLLPHDNDGQYCTNITRILGSHPQIYVCTQSCRARCTFCSTYLVHGTTKARPSAMVRQDLEYLVRERGHDCIEFHDDDLLQHPEFNALLEILGELGVPWFCFARVPPITSDVAQRMATSCCQRIFLGVESMDQTVLDYYNKGTSVEQNERAIDALAGAGIETVAGLIIGAPEDTVESIIHSFERYLSLPLSGISCSILSPDPGTVEFHRARKRRVAPLPALGGTRGAPRATPDVVRYGVEEPAGLPVVCRNVTKADLNRLTAIFEAEFYLRPHMLMRSIRGRSVTQCDRLRAFFEFLWVRVRRLDLDGAHPAVSCRHAALQHRLETAEHKLAIACAAGGDA